MITDTNTITQAHEVLTITPQHVAYTFKEWAGVASMIFASIYTSFHAVFPRVQAFIDTRDGGAFQLAFYQIFGKPKQEQSKPTP